mgnify:CR=1 FL=1
MWTLFKFNLTNFFLLKKNLFLKIGDKLKFIINLKFNV